MRLAADYEVIKVLLMMSLSC